MCIIYLQMNYIYSSPDISPPKKGRKKERKTTEECVYLLRLSCLVELDWKMNYFMPG